MNPDSFNLGDFLGTLGSAYGNYTSSQTANNTAQAQQQIALLNAQSQAQQASTTKTVLFYGLIAVAIIAVIYVFKKVL